MMTVTIKIEGARGHQAQEVSNVSVFYGSKQVDRYVTRNVERLVQDIKEDCTGVQVVVKDER